MNFANFRAAILAILGLPAFNKVDDKETLSEAECKKLKTYNFSDRFLEGFKAYLNNPEGHGDSEVSENTQSAVIAGLLGDTAAQLQAVTAERDELKRLQESKSSHAAALQEKERVISALNEKINVLSKLPEADPGSTAGSSGSATPAFDLNDTKQLGGQQGAFFSLERAYNKRARAALLAAQGMEVHAVASHNTMDYQSLKEDLGAFYRTPWSQRIQTFIVELPTITKIFRTESGHQDLSTLVNLWLGEFSQADNSNDSDFDNVTKGSFSFGHETLRMYDVMFAFKFKSLKDLEKSWIGYLNREGSSPVKLSFIEYILVQTAIALHNERELRYVNGVRKDPDPNKPGRAMDAADGIYEYIRKRVDGYTDFTPNGGTTGNTIYQIKPFELPRITHGNIGEVFYLGTGMIPSAFRDTGKIVLYIPSFMLPWYHKYNEAHYGQNTDYQAGISYVKEFPSVRIETIPNADNHHRIFWTIEGNIKTYEHISGEMLRFSLEQQDWSVKVWSNWKESIAAEAVGYKYTDRESMDGSRQVIWCNDYDRPDSYFIESERDSNPSALLHSSVITVANSKLFSITDISDAPTGTLLSVKCGADGDNGVIIKKEGKFALISAEWKPVKGDILRVMKRADGMFVEIGRSSAAEESYQFPDDETTPSLRGATVFITGNNSQATAITGFTDAVPGTLYTIHGSGAEHASTIANGDKFILTEDMTLKAGSFIKIVMGDDNKFYEVARG